jgi:DNA-binding HxlR family transcriptional regulator
MPLAGLSAEAAVDVDRVTEALGMITPRWSVRILLALSGGPLRQAEVKAAVPQASSSQVHGKIEGLCAAGIVTRTEHSSHHVTYENTSRVPQLLAVLPTLANWSQEHLESPQRELSQVEHVEDALALLTRRHTAAILWTLKSRGPSSGRALAALVMPHTSWTNIYPPVRQLLDDGLVDHEGTGSAYRLTEAGDALSPTLAGLSMWASGRPLSQAATHPVWGWTARTAPEPAEAARAHRSAPPTTSTPPPWKRTALFSHSTAQGRLDAAVAGGPRR